MRQGVSVKSNVPIPPSLWAAPHLMNRALPDATMLSRERYPVMFRMQVGRKSGIRLLPPDSHSVRHSHSVRRGQRLGAAAKAAEH